MLANIHYHKLFILLFAVLLNGCATTSGNNAPVMNTDEIVINEEYGIDTELKDKFDLAIKHIKNKKYNDAIELLVEVTNKTKKHSAPYINLAIAYSRIGKAQDAEKTLLKAIKINPAHPVTNNELGLLYRKMGRFTDAKEYYENVIKDYPQFLPTRKNLGILCDLFLSDLDCAISNYEAFLQIQPNDKKVKIWLVDLKRRAGRE